jgi:hypothetical protein
MRRLYAGRIVVMAAGLAMLWPAPASAQGQADTGPTVEVHMRTLKRGGGVGMTAYGNNPFVPGTPVNWFITAGNSNPSEMTVCGGGVGEVGTLEQKLSRSAFVWQVKMLPSKYENGNVTFDLEWTRYQADGGGRPTTGGKSTLTLREGERQAIDLVHGAQGSRCDDDVAVVEVGAGYHESPQFARAILQYDIWLTHRQLNGEPVVHRFVAMGQQGDDVNFSFVPLRFAVQQSKPEQAAYDVVTSVQGTVRGRIQANGRIALTLDTSRRDGLGARGATSGGSSGNKGEKLLEVAPGEAIEIELPAPGGRSSTSAGKGAAAIPNGGQGRSASGEAVSIVDGRLVVDNALFFKGQRTSLIVKVTQVTQ